MKIAYDILLAEDDDMLRNFIDVSLKRAGYRVMSVENGELALEAFQSHDFTVLISDIKMPEINGFELAQRVLSSINPDIKIIFITGFNAVALEAKDRYSNSAIVLSKPFHLKQLTKHIDQMLAIKINNPDNDDEEG